MPPCTIKDLTRQAIYLLEASYFSQRMNHSRSCTTDVTFSASVAAQLRELAMLCKSHENMGLLVTANTVTQLALERKTPTLLITAKCSPPVFVVSLLLWRAGLTFESAARPAWSEAEFARLAVAAGDVARSRLIVVTAVPFANVRKTILAAIANDRTRWVVLDTVGTITLVQLARISCELRVQITVISSSYVGP